MEQKRDISPEQYTVAVRYVVENGRASASMLQRKLRIGYGLAIDLIRMMQREGVVDDNFLPKTESPAVAQPMEQGTEPAGNQGRPVENA